MKNCHEYFFFALKNKKSATYNGNGKLINYKYSISQKYIFVNSF